MVHLGRCESDDLKFKLLKRVASAVPRPSGPIVQFNLPPRINLLIDLFCMSCNAIPAFFHKKKKKKHSKAEFPDHLQTLPKFQKSVISIEKERLLSRSILLGRAIKLCVHVFFCIKALHAQRINEKKELFRHRFNCNGKFIGSALK